MITQLSFLYVKHSYDQLKANLPGRAVYIRRQLPALKLEDANFQKDEKQSE